MKIIEKQNGFTTYEHTFRKGDMPGDQCIDWWTQKDWDDWNQHIIDLKKSGEYGKKEKVTITMKDHPFWDVPVESLTKKLESSRIVFLDFSK